MQLINGIERLPADSRPIYVALGNFDGVHRGHQEILKATVEKAKMNKGFSAALVFDPHPLVALRPEQPLCLLTDIADRAEIMSTMGLDYLVVEPFNHSVAKLSPEKFTRQILLDRLKISGVFVGENYTFGQQGAGKAETLKYWGEKLGFEVGIIPMQSWSGKAVSSSKIRSLLLSGSVREAAGLLNYHFFRYGRVVKGYGTGKRATYPTANINASPRLLWPGKGVYLTAVENLGNGPFFGVTNVGSRPTFSRHDSTVETHILDFNGTIYNYEIRLCFLEKLRDTRTFASAEQLKAQIGKDIEVGIKIIESLAQENKGISNSLQAGCSVLKSQ